MSIIDHAAVQIPTGVTKSRRTERRLTTPVRVALAFVAAHIPLWIIAIACEWPATDNTDSVAADVLLYGSPMSGPFTAQLIILTLALIATRRRRWVSTVGHAGLAVFGLLIIFNGGSAGLADPQWAPKAVGVLGGVFFLLAGSTMTITAIRELLARRSNGSLRPEHL